MPPVLPTRVHFATSRASSTCTSIPRTNFPSYFLFFRGFRFFLFPLVFSCLDSSSVSCGFGSLLPAFSCCSGSIFSRVSFPFLGFSDEVLPPIRVAYPEPSFETLRLVHHVRPFAPRVHPILQQSLQFPGWA